MSLSLYALTVLIWGTTFYVVTFQVGSVPAEQSVFYRYALAALLMWIISAIRGGMPRFSGAIHLRFLALGLCMFSLNYVVVYMAVERLPSGLVSVVFSMAILVNTLQLWVFFGEKPDVKLLVGAVLGILGLSLLFLDEIATSTVNPVFFAGLGFALTASLSAATGNLVSHRLSERSIDVVHANTWAMTYGSLLTAAYIVFTGKALAFDFTVAYVSSLFYLAILGSVVAFYTYLTLVGQIGAPRASYVSIFYSMVALLLSTLLEGLVWTQIMFLGVAMILLGNVFVLRRRT